MTTSERNGMHSSVNNPPHLHVQTASKETVHPSLGSKHLHHDTKAYRCLHKQKPRQAVTEAKRCVLLWRFRCLALHQTLHATLLFVFEHVTRLISNLTSQCVQGIDFHLTNASCEGGYEVYLSEKGRRMMCLLNWEAGERVGSRGLG
jgi:hypothetical protein